MVAELGRRGLELAIAEQGRGTPHGRKNTPQEVFGLGTPTHMSRCVTRHRSGRERRVDELRGALGRDWQQSWHYAEFAHLR